MIVAAVVAVGLLAVASMVVTVNKGRRWPRRLMRARVIVTLKTGAAFSGVLYEVSGDLLVLRDTQWVTPSSGGGPVQVDGEVLIARADVDYLQRP